MAGDTVSAMRQLFHQLNPASVDDYIVLALERGTARGPVVRPFEDGLLSVIIRNHSLDRLKFIDQALFSLSCQAWSPLEVVLVSQSTEADVGARLEQVLARFQPLGRYSYQVVLEPSSKDIRARLLNVGLSHARGRYVAILDDDDVIYPNHYQRLIDALQSSDHAWAFAPVRRAYFGTTAAGDLYCKRKDTFPRSDTLALAQLLHDNYVTCHSYVIDRSRLGQFSLGFEERLSKGEDYVMLLRLLALFRPIAVGGSPSAEYRIRDDGTNTIVHDTDDAEARARLIAQWEEAIAVKNQLTDELQVLISKKDLVAEAIRSIELEARSGPEELRYRIADFANSALKSALPTLHSVIRRPFMRD